MRDLRNKNQRGFTLIELLVVIAIIGLLASVVLLALNSARSKARDARRVSDVRQIMSALELYLNDCNSYPVEASPVTLGDANHDVLRHGGLTTCGDNTGEDVGGNPDNGGFAAVAGGTSYIVVVPSAPTPQDGTCTTAENAYTYTAAVGGANYTLAFCLGGPSGSLGQGVRTASASGIQ